MHNISARKSVYSTKFCNLIAKTVGSGEIEPYYSIKLNDYVAILAVTENNEILLVRQYRPAVESFTLELPAGLLEVGEDPAEAAQRELAEETGFIADKIEYLGCLYTDTGRLDNRMWCYFAKGVKPRKIAQPVEDGLECLICPLSNLEKMLAKGEFTHALHLAVFFLALSKGKLPLLCEANQMSFSKCP